MRGYLPSLRPSPFIVTSFAHIVDVEIHSAGVGGEAVQSCILRAEEGVTEGIQVFYVVLNAARDGSWYRDRTRK